jgi:hypothetical protein
MHINRGEVAEMGIKIYELSMDYKICLSIDQEIFLAEAIWRPGIKKRLEEFS